MGREQKRRLDARKAKQLVQSGKAQRRPMSDAEAESLFLAIDQGEVQKFGIGRIAALELDNLHRAPWCFGSSLWTTLLDFAAWRGRDSFVCALMAAGADPSRGEVAPSVWEKLPRAYSAWLARAAVRLRNQAPASATCATCICGKKASGLFSPCGHVCCSSCPWSQFQTFASSFGRLPELLCPTCSVSFEDPSMEFVAQRRGIIRCDRAPPWISESNRTTCQHCGCFNTTEATLCINCGWTPSQPREPKESTCFNWTFTTCFNWLTQLSGKTFDHVTCFPAWLRRKQKLQSLHRWKELPEELQELHTSSFWKENTEQDLPAKQSGKRAGAFRALNPKEVAWEKLGLSRSTRLERLRVAAEMGDVRRLAALLEAGSDVDAEYGQSPLYLAAVEGHLEAIKVPRLCQKMSEGSAKFVNSSVSSPSESFLRSLQSFCCVFSLQVLLWWGADAALPCHGGATAYDAAKSSGHTAVCRLLKWELWKFSCGLGLSGQRL
eukprot:Skav208137  [mRNA]  locus=scaffold4270:64026:66485:+ [translate_table: standard]